MTQSQAMSSTKVRLFAPLLASVFATASVSCAAVVGIESAVGGAIPGRGMVLILAMALLFAAAALWYFGLRPGDLPGSVRRDDENTIWLTITSASFGTLLFLAFLPASWLWFARILLAPAGLALLYFLGNAHRISADEDWMERVQTWSPPFSALLLAIAISAGCLQHEWAEIPLILLLLVDAGLSVARYQTLDSAVRAAKNTVTNPLRKATNAAMLLRFFTGTIFAALFLGMRPGFVPVAILGAFIIDRLLLQVSVIMVQHAEAEA